MSEETPLGSSLVIAGLQAALKTPIDDRLVIAKKAIVGIESQKLKLTHRLAEEIRRIVKSVLKSKTATPSQLDAAIDLKERLYARSPRRKINQGPERVLDDFSTGQPGSILGDDHDPTSESDDLWISKDFDEVRRVATIDEYRVGDFKSKVRAALNGREETIENLVNLHTFCRATHMTGPMVKELEAMLIERVAVKEVPQSEAALEFCQAVQSFKEILRNIEQGESV